MIGTSEKSPGAKQGQKLMRSTEKGGLELLKVWITELLVMFMRCLIRSNVLQDLLNKLFVVG